MIILTCALIGAAWGAWRAKGRGGNRADMLQYAATHALLGALLGLFVTIFISRII